MASLTVQVSGSATVDEAWKRYLYPARWPAWTPHLTHVCAGTHGTVTALGVIPARFDVQVVDPGAHSWSWTVRIGPITLTLHHGLDGLSARQGADGVTGSIARILMEGPWPVLVIYRPLMRWAMRRLVR